MGLSLKQAASSTVGKILTGAAIFAAGHMIDKSAEAAEVTTIVHDDVAICIGADMGGFISVLKMGAKGTLTDGKSTAFEPTGKEVNNDKMYNPYSYRTELHRNFAITYYPPNNDITEGHRLYNTDTGNEELVINATNYPDYINGVDIHFVKGATPDQDQMVFLGNTTFVYKSPLDANGNVKPECKKGPIKPDFIYPFTFKFDACRANGNAIFCFYDDFQGGQTEVRKFAIGDKGIVQDSAIIIGNIGANTWGNTDVSFVSYKDANAKETTYLIVGSGTNTKHLFNVADITDHKQTDAYSIAVLDPAGRFEFKRAKDATGKFANFLTDTHANPVITKNIGSDGKYSDGNTAYLDNYPTPAWVVYSNTKSVYLIELLDVATMNTKVTKMPLDIFTQKYAGGVANCAPLPNPKVTVTKTGGTPDAGGDTGATEGVVEKDQDAGATEVDAAAEVVDAPDGMSSDADAAIDAWVDGGSDMQDIFAADETGTPDVGPDVGPDQADAAVDGVVIPPDMSIEDASLDGSLPPDVQPDTQGDVTTAPDGKADAQETSEVDGTVIPPDMSTGDAPLDGSLPPDVQGKDAMAADADDVQMPQPDNGTDTPFDTGAKPGLDAGSSDTSGQPIVSAPAPKDTGCNAGGNSNNLSPLAIAAATALAIGLARKREEES